MKMLERNAVHQVIGDGSRATNAGAKRSKYVAVAVAVQLLWLTKQFTTAHRPFPYLHLCSPHQKTTAGEESISATLVLFELYLKTCKKVNRKNFSQ